MIYQVLDIYQNYCVKIIINEEFWWGNNSVNSVQVEKVSTKYFGQIYAIKSLLKDIKF